MFEIYRWSEPEIFAFILVLLRISTCFVAWPIFGNDQVPGSVKILAPLLIAFLIYPSVGWKQIRPDLMSATLISLAMKEASVGLIIGFVARCFFLSLSALGEMSSLAVGLSSEQLFNPSTGGRASVVEQYYVLIGSVLFLSLNGHHVMINGLSESYKMLPLSHSLRFESMYDVGMKLREVSVAGLKLSAPIMVAMFILNASMGIVSRIVPQINILVTSLSVNLLVGFFIMIVSLPLALSGMTGLLDDLMKNLFLVMKGL